MYRIQLDLALTVEIKHGILFQSSWSYYQNLPASFSLEVVPHDDQSRKNINGQVDGSKPVVSDN